MGGESKIATIHLSCNASYSHLHGDLCEHDRVILWHNMAFGWEWVVLHTLPSVFGKFWVHAWRYVGGLDEVYPTSVY